MGHLSARSVSAVLLFACTGLAASLPTASGFELPAIPDTPEAEQFVDVPSPWREYMMAARKAQSIADPLERCLAFPDLPGNRWPEGHTQAHCRYHHEPLLSLDEVERLLLDGQPGELERLVTAYQDRHSAGADASEIIHRFFQQFNNPGAQAQAIRIADAWLEAIPDSAYANVAKAQTLKRSGWNARGGQFASQTARENFRHMRAFMDEAIPYYHKAIASSPDLIDAWIGLMNIAKADSRDELEQSAFQQGQSVDPACPELALTRMSALSPRWGGSMETMLAYSNTLQRHVQERPLLANQIAAPYVEAGWARTHDDQHDRHAVEVTEVALRMSSNDDALQRGARLMLHRTDNGATDHWRGIALYLQESRFREISTHARKVIALELVQAEPEWAVSMVLPIVEARPEDTEGHYFLAVSLYNSGLFEPAEKHYLLALPDEQYRQHVLRELSAMWLLNPDIPEPEAARKAAPYISRLLEAWPDDGRGHLYRLQQHAFENGFIKHEHIKSFLETADPDDPYQHEFIEALRDAR